MYSALKRQFIINKTRRNILPPMRGCRITNKLMSQTSSSVLISFNRVSNRNLCYWSAVISMSCGYLDIAHMSVLSWVDLSYSSNVPFSSDKIRLCKNNNITNTHISSLEHPLSRFSRRTSQFVEQTQLSLSGIPASAEWPLGYPV